LAPGPLLKTDSGPSSRGGRSTPGTAWRRNAPWPYGFRAPPRFTGVYRGLPGRTRPRSRGRGGSLAPGLALGPLSDQKARLARPGEFAEEGLSKRQKHRGPGRGRGRDRGGGTRRQGENRGPDHGRFRKGACRARPRVPEGDARPPSRLIWTWWRNGPRKSQKAFQAPAKRPEIP
jgi:hypothetical protein